MAISEAYRKSAENFFPSVLGLKVFFLVVQDINKFISENFSVNNFFSDGYDIQSYYASLKRMEDIFFVASVYVFLKFAGILE